MDSLICQQAQFVGDTFRYLKSVKFVVYQQRDVVELLASIDQFCGSTEDALMLVIGFEAGEPARRLQKLTVKPQNNSRASSQPHAVENGSSS